MDTKECCRKDKCVHPLGSTLPLEEFATCFGSEDGRHKYCRACWGYCCGFNYVIPDISEYIFQEDNLTKSEGYVYIVKLNNYYKIGIEKDVKQRVYNFNTPTPIEIIHTFKSDHYSTAEKLLHKKYKSKKERREWFNLDDNDIEYLKSIRGFDGSKLLFV